MYQIILDFITNHLAIVVSAIVTLAGVFLYRRQEAQSKDIANVAKANEEWVKIAERRDRENERLNNKIDEVYLELAAERQKTEDERNKRLAVEEQLSKERQLSALLRGQKCTRYNCQDREPPLEEIISPRLPLASELVKEGESQA